MGIIKKALIASAVATALSGTANAGSLLFDTDGSFGAGPVLVINAFDWVPGNMLITNTTPIGSVTESLAIYSQGELGTLTKPGPDFGYTVGQLTYQMRTWADAAADGSAIVYSAGTVPMGSSTFFEIYYNPTPATIDDVTGCGYGANEPGSCGVYGGTLIYRGTADIVDSATLTQSGTLVQGLDQSSDGIDHDGGITTRSLGLSTLTLNVNTVTYDASFFLSDIDSLTTDVVHTEQGGGTPFLSPNPSDTVVGVTPDYGDGINNIGTGSCGAPANNPCDVHLQSDASSIIQTTYVPEPQSLALLGLGLAALGVRLKRRTKRTLV